MRIDVEKDAKRQLGQEHGRGKAARCLRPGSHREKRRDTCTKEREVTVCHEKDGNGEHVEDDGRRKQEEAEDLAKRATQNPKSWRARRRVRGTRTSPSAGHPATKRCRANVYRVCHKIVLLQFISKT